MRPDIGGALPGDSQPSQWRRVMSRSEQCGHRSGQRACQRRKPAWRTESGAPRQPRPKHSHGPPQAPYRPGGEACCGGHRSDRRTARSLPLILGGCRGRGYREGRCAPHCIRAQPRTCSREHWPPRYGLVPAVLPANPTRTGIDTSMHAQSLRGSQEAGLRGAARLRGEPDCNIQ